MPLTWVIGLLLASLFVKNKIRKRHFLVLSIGTLILFSNPFIVNTVMCWWEIKPVAFDNLEKADIGIVLTGVANLKKMPQDRTYFNKGADRIYHAVMLYKKNKISKILITGGNIEFGTDGLSEAHTLKEYLLFSGIPKEAIILEDMAKNTQQNAIFTKNKLESLNLQHKKLILITSSYHMRRSKACFDKVGLKTTAFPTDFYSTDVVNWESFIPSIKAMSFSGVLLHELFGISIYKLLGYI